MQKPAVWFSRGVAGNSCFSLHFSAHCYVFKLHVSADWSSALLARTDQSPLTNVVTYSQWVTDHFWEQSM